MKEEEEYMGVGKTGFNCAYAYWDDDDINDDLSQHISGPYCGCEKAKEPYGGGAGACSSKDCEFWRLRGRKDHRIWKAEIEIDSPSEFAKKYHPVYIAEDWTWYLKRDGVCGDYIPTLEELTTAARNMLSHLDDKCSCTSSRGIIAYKDGDGNHRLEFDQKLLETQKEKKRQVAPTSVPIDYIMFAKKIDRIEFGDFEEHEVIEWNGPAGRGQISVNGRPPEVITEVLKRTFGDLIRLKDGTKSTPEEFVRTHGMSYWTRVVATPVPTPHFFRSYDGHHWSTPRTAQRCPVCFGGGKVMRQRIDPAGHYARGPYEESCNGCGGTGVVWG